MLSIEDDKYYCIDVITHRKYNVVDGLDKLIDYFNNTFKSKTTITYINIDTSNIIDDVWFRHGFKLDEITPPDCYLINKKMNRLKGTTHNLYNNDKTEYEIYDSGKFKLKRKLNATKR